MKQRNRGLLTIIGIAEFNINVRVKGVMLFIAINEAILKMKTSVKMIIFLGYFLGCQQKAIIIEDTKNFIAFERAPEAGSIVDFDVWLINIRTKEEIRLTQNLEYWEYGSVWLSDSELLYLIEPQEKTGTETDIIYINLKTGKRRLLDYWTWENCPRTGGISVDSLRNIYYANFEEIIYVLVHKENKYQLTTFFSDRGSTRFRPEDLGLKEIFNPVVSSDGSKLLFCACDTAKYRRLGELKKFHYDIYLYDCKEKSLKRLTEGDSTYEDPIWIGNDTIVFCSNCDGNYELYLMALKDKNMIRLTSTEDISEMEPTVSPDHQQIAYMRYQGEYRFKDVEIWIMDLKTKETWFLTKGGSPAWSPAK